MPIPSYLRTALRLALLAGTASSCAPYVEPYDAGPDADPCAIAAVGDPCPSHGLTCQVEGVTPCGLLFCDEPPLQNPRWIAHSCLRGPLPPPELTA